jgi:hypothetical protein
MKREPMLSPLRNLAGEMPTTKMGQVRWALPEIRAALAAGHTLKRVHERLLEVGIRIPYRTLSLYIGRLEREQPKEVTEPAAAARSAEKMPPPLGVRLDRGLQTSGTAPDPFTNIRREREKKKGTAFTYDAFSTTKKLLE